MNIQNFFLLCLAAIILIEAWKKIVPNYQFINTSCMVGSTQKGQTTKKVVDCIACESFPIQVSQKGQIQVINGDIQQLKQHNTNGQSQFHLLMYMQSQCTEYECHELQNSQYFIDKKLLQAAGLHPVRQINKAVSDDLWEFSLPYDNRLSQDKHTDSAKNRFINLILSPLLPYSFLPAKQFYSSLVIKLRYTQPLQKKNEDIVKPVIKISVVTPSVSDLLVISILIFFTLAIKRHVFNSKNKLDLNTLILSLSFISPYLFSIISFIILAAKTPHHVIALFLFVASLCLDIQLLALCGVAMSSIIQMMKGSKIMTIQQIALFNLFIVIASIFGIDNVLSTAPTLLCAFCQELTLDYSSIQQKQKTKMSIDLQKHQQLGQQDH